MPKKKVPSKSKRSSLKGRNTPELVTEQKTVQDQFVVTPPEVITDEQPIVKLDKLGRVTTDAPQLKPYHFKPGQSGNPLGRGKDPVREIGKRIAAAKVNKSLKAEDRELAEQLGFTANDMTLLEHLMLGLATSHNPMKIELFLKRTFGNVPNININAEVSAQLVSRFKSKFTDSELEAIGDGASAMDILFDKLPDVEQDDEGTVDAEWENE